MHTKPPAAIGAALFIGTLLMGIVLIGTPARAGARPEGPTEAELDAMSTEELEHELLSIERELALVQRDLFHLAMRAEDAHAAGLRREPQQAPVRRELLRAHPPRRDEVFHKLLLHLREDALEALLHLAHVCGSLFAAAQFLHDLHKSAADLALAARFQQVMLDAVLHRLGGVFELAVAREDDELHLRVARLHPPQKLEAVHHGHADVGDDDVGRIGGDHLVRLVPVGRDALEHGTVPLPADRPRHPLADNALVVSQKHLVHEHPPLRTPPG